MEEYFNAIKKYNFWDENTPESGYHRADYTDKIYTYTGNPSRTITRKLLFRLTICSSLKKTV